MIRGKTSWMGSGLPLLKLTSPHYTQTVTHNNTPPPNIMVTQTNAYKINICNTITQYIRMICYVSLIQRTYQIIVADAADAVGVNFSGRCKFFQTERENLPFYCVHSMYNVCNLYKFVLIYEHLGVEFQLQKLYQCKKNDNYQV